MLEMLKFFGFFLIFLRYILWISFSFDRIETYSLPIFFSQVVEGLFVFFFFIQLSYVYVPMGQSSMISIFGFLLVAGGVLLAVLGKKTLGNEWIHAYSYKKQKGKQVITTGIYEYVRNPIYTGIVASYVGMELLVGSWLWVSMLFLFIPFWYQVRKEEEFLTKKFGKKYLAYCATTNRFLPFLW